MTDEYIDLSALRENLPETMHEECACFEKAISCLLNEK